MTNYLKMGVAGDVGSFSEAAALQYAEQKKITPGLVYLTDMEGVLNAIEQNEIGLGIFPVFNFRGGWVKPAFIAMGKHAFTPLDECWLDVRQCLLTLPGTTKNQIKQIASHPQALAQCKSYLQNEFPHVEQIEWIDTAKAANDLAGGQLPPSTAVIAPERAGQVYHLNLLAQNIQDHSPNYTIFIVATHRQPGAP